MPGPVRKSKPNARHIERAVVDEVMKLLGYDGDTSQAVAPHPSENETASIGSRSRHPRPIDAPNGGGLFG